MTEYLDLAYKLLASGFSVIPSGGGESGKAPIIKWEPYQSRLPDKKEIEHWDYRDKPALWGIVTGEISGLVVIDADDAEARAKIEATGIKPHIETPRGGAHYYFQHPGYPVKTVAGLLQKIDIRADGGFVNCLGGRYHTVILPARDNLYPWTQLPDFIATRVKPDKTTTTAPKQLETIAEGQRNDHLTSLAGSMNRRGMSKSSIEVALLNENRERCLPPLAESEVLAIAKSVVSRYEPSPQPVKKYSSMQNIKQVRNEILARPPADDLIQDLLPDSSSAYMLIVGRPGIGKTNLALNLIFCLASGTPFFSHKTKTCRVGYLSFEGSDRKILQRFDTIGRSFNGAESNISWEHTIPFTLIGEGQAKFKSIITGQDVILVDTLRHMVPGDYTTPKDASAFLTSLRKVQNETSTRIIFLHHIRKPDKRIKVQPDDLMFEVKGASEYVEGATTVLLLEKAPQGKDGYGKFTTTSSDRMLYFTKVKDAPTDLRPIRLQFNRETMLFEPVTTEYEEEEE
jgi:hypothetical protein